MIENLEAYCDINELDNKLELLAAGKVIVENGEKEVVSLCPSGSVLVAFWKLLEDEIDLETFMKIGDVSSDYPLYEQPLPPDAVTYLHTTCELDEDAYSDSIVVLSQGTDLTGVAPLLTERNSLVVSV